MPFLPVVAFATPLFGFALTPPSAPAPNFVLMLPPLLAQEAPEGADQLVPPPEDGAESPDNAEDGGNGEGASDSTAELMERRQRIANVHRPFGIATWAMYTVTAVFGYIQYHNLYGFFAGQDENPCARGNAVFGNNQCTGVPYLHLTSALLTTALYFTTFGLSFAMPDPVGLAEGDSDYARKLRTHRTLRWVHFSGMVGQFLLGLVIANGHWFGLDRANDYRTLQALSTVHVATGFLTYGALTWAGALFVAD